MSDRANERMSAAEFRRRTQEAPRLPGLAPTHRWFPAALAIDPGRSADIAWTDGCRLIPGTARVWPLWWVRATTNPSLALPRTVPPVASVRSLRAASGPDCDADSTRPVRVVYQRVDQVQQSTTVFGGRTAGQVTFRRVRTRNLNTDAVVRDVEVTVSEGKEVQISSMSTGMLGAAVGTSVEFINAFGARVAEAGFIFLSVSDVSKIVDFFDRVPRQVQKDQGKVWKIWLDKNFELGIEFSPEDYAGTSLLTG